MVVDVIRRCYRSKWRLFSDSSALVSGRYYEAPAGTPAYPFFHMYGSRDWDQKPNELPPEFGESRSTPHIWDPGQLPVDLPLAVTVGSPRCAAGPRPIATAVPYDQTLDGWLPACLGIPPELLRWFTYTSFMRCTTQLLWAWVICELYDNNTATITALLVKLLGDVDIIYHPRFGLSTFVSGEKFPRILVATSGDWYIVAAEGTTNAQQAALEGLYSPLGPREMGGYSTHQLWQDIANRMLAQLEDAGYVSGLPIFLTGHSLGGAALLVLAAMLRIGNPGTRIRYLTFGAPAIGDLRIVGLLSTCEGTCLDNVGDFVPALPFGFEEIGPVVPLVGPFLPLVLDRWLSAPRHWRQFGDGTLLAGRDIVQFSAAIIELYVQIGAGLVVAPFSAHRIAEYIRRIRLRCPGVSWPILDPLDYLTLTSCTPDPFGWIYLGGDLPVVANAGALELGNRRAFFCSQAIPVVAQRLYAQFPDPVLAGMYFQYTPAGPVTVGVTFTNTMGFSVDVDVGTGPCSAPTFVGIMSNIYGFITVAISPTAPLLLHVLPEGGPQFYTLWIDLDGNPGPGAATRDGTLDLGGVIPVISPPPATTCAAAPALASGTTYHYRVTWGSGPFQWLGWPALTGATYTIVISGSSSDGGWQVLWVQRSCVSPLLIGIDNSDNTRSGSLIGPGIFANIRSTGATYVEFDLVVS